MASDGGVSLDEEVVGAWEDWLVIPGREGAEGGVGSGVEEVGHGLEGGALGVSQFYPEGAGGELDSGAGMGLDGYIAVGDSGCGAHEDIVGAWGDGGVGPGAELVEFLFGPGGR